MKLTEKPDFIDWPETHYLFLEKVGSIPENAPKVWENLNQHLPEIMKTYQATRFFSQYKLSPEAVYRAGVGISKKPTEIPQGLKFEEFKGGKYARFILTGSYSQLPDACGRVFEIFERSNLKLREDYFIENYVNDPRTTPEEKLITEILIPV